MSIEYTPIKLPRSRQRKAAVTPGAALDSSCFWLLMSICSVPYADYCSWAGPFTRPRVRPATASQAREPDRDAPASCLAAALTDRS